MKILQMLASAEVSKDLQHHEHQCHVDILGAAGMAKFGAGIIAVYRLKFMDDNASSMEAYEQFWQWTMRAAARRKYKLRNTDRELTSSIMEYWLFSNCAECFGRKFKVLNGTPSLTDKPCDVCNGTGLRRMVGNKEVVQIKLDVIGKADRAIHELNGIISQKLGRK